MDAGKVWGRRCNYEDSMGFFVLKPGDWGIGPKAPGERLGRGIFLKREGACNPEALREDAPSTGDSRDGREATRLAQEFLLLNSVCQMLPPFLVMCQPLFLLHAASPCSPFLYTFTLAPSFFSPGCGRKMISRSEWKWDAWGDSVGLLDGPDLDGDVGRYRIPLDD